MGKWVAQADGLDDVVVEKGLAAFVVERVSDATSFQHFAYCGSMGDLTDGTTKVEKYDGYCWDCDPFLTWYEEIANISWADVRFNPDNGVFDRDFWRDSPAKEMISGAKDWDDQVYPSALDMAAFYGRKAKELKASRPQWALQAMCFGIHMLQDVAVPQHVMCTIEKGHAEYEREMLGFWRNLYAGDGRSDRRRQSLLRQQIAPTVAALLSSGLAEAPTMRAIGERGVDLTRDRLSGSMGVPEACKAEAMSVTCQAIACTLKALDAWHAW
jgi:hypothetical protein